MKTKYIFLILILIFSLKFYSQEKQVISEDLEIIKISDNAFVHISYKEYSTFGRVPCNGLIYMNNNEAVILDTPPDSIITSQLLSWIIKKFPEVKIKGVIVNHFHEDCLGGLNEFHKLNIKSYSYESTPALAEKINLPVPQNTFKAKLDLEVGKEKIICMYFGEAHTKDNIVVWIPDEEILFGGCMIKSLNSSKGNLVDANVGEWANTVTKVKREFPDSKVIVPGHGAVGGKELFDYTIKLFTEEVD
jgi:metallo-beta-lactamase class B